MGHKTPPLTPDNSVPSQSNLEAAQSAVDKAAPSTGLQPQEIVSAPQELVPFKDAALAGDTVITGLPGEAAGPLSATTLADGAATGVPASSIGYLDAAGNFFSALIGSMSTGALILASVVAVGIVGAVVAGVYYRYHGGLSSQQATAVVDQVRDPNSDETLQSLRQTNQNSSSSPSAQGSMVRRAPAAVSRHNPAQTPTDAPMWGPVAGEWALMCIVTDLPGDPGERKFERTVVVRTVKSGSRYRLLGALTTPSNGPGVQTECDLQDDWAPAGPNVFVNSCKVPDSGGWHEEGQLEFRGRSLIVNLAIKDGTDELVDVVHCSGPRVGSN